MNSEDFSMFLVFQTQAEQHVYECLAESLETLGYEIVRVRFFKKPKVTLQLMIDVLNKSSSKTVTIDDCERASKHVSVLLGMHDEFRDMDYDLEVSSAGIQRPLTRIKDLLSNIGNKVKVRTFKKQTEINSSKMLGHIISVNDGVLILSICAKLNSEYEVKLDEIADITLDVNLDDLVKKSSSTKT